MSVSVSGYLPDEQHNGLTALGDELCTRFAKQASRKGGNVDITVPVVGVYRVVSVKRHADPDKPPVAELRFGAVEAVLTPDDQAEVLELIGRLRDKRTGDQPIDGLDGGQHPGGSTSSREAGGKLSELQRERAAADFGDGDEAPDTDGEGPEPSEPDDSVDLPDTTTPDDEASNVSPFRQPASS